ncbi:MAG: hypothetical protein KDA74_22190, partial [Planctomycetaceae bacterium]|nr:hypothetical protein [Planctomycetaceae bacterium]
MNVLLGMPTDQTLLWMFNVLIQTSCIALCAILAGLVLRRSPAARYGMLCSALFLVCLCPIVAAVLQSTNLSLLIIPVKVRTPDPVASASQESQTAAPAPDLSISETTLNVDSQ